MGKKRYRYAIGCISKSKEDILACTGKDGKRKVESRVQITHYDSSETSKKLPVIPPKPNERRPAKRMKNLDLPLHPDSASASSSDLSRFQSTAGPSTKANAGVSHTVRRRENGRELSLGEVKPEAPGQSGLPPPSSVSAENHPGYPTDILSPTDSEAVRHGTGVGLIVEGPAVGLEDMPVKEFAKAFLRGYGWQEGKVWCDGRSFSKAM